MSEERIGVQICTRNRNSYLASLMLSLHQQTIQNWDLIIVDDCSDRPVAKNKHCMDIIQFLRNNKHKVQLITNPTRLLVCKSRNIALMNDNHEICCRIDDDSYLDPDYLKKLWRIIKFDKKIGAVGGIVPYLAQGFGDDEKTFGYARNTNKIEFFNHTTCDKKGESLAWDDMGHYHWYPNKIIPSHHLRSSYMFRKKALEEVGGFDEWTGVTGFSEETINCLKMLEKGWKLYTDTGAKAWHLVATGDGRDLCGRKYEDLVAGNKRKAKKVLKPILASLYKQGILKDRDASQNRGTIIEL